MNDTSPPSPHPQLDQFLRSWLDRAEIGAEQMHDLRAQIVEQCAAELNTATSATSVRSLKPIVRTDSEESTTGGRRIGDRRTPRQARLAEFALCAVLLLAVAGLSIRTSQDTGHGADNAGADLAAVYGDAEGASKLFLACRELFSDRLAWVAESTSRTHLGLLEAASHDAEDPLEVRVSLARRRHGSRSWNVVWTTDIVTATSQPIRFGDDEVPGESALRDRIAELWAYRLPDGLVYVESRVRLDSRREISSESASLLQQNQPTLVATVNEEGEEFRLYHTVAALAPGGNSR